MNLHRRRAAGQARKPRLTSLRRLRQERGQTLVEYALIIAVVSLGALAALGFLSGRIQNLFSKAGNSIEAVTIGAPVGGGGSPPPPPPPSTPPPNNAPINSQPNINVEGAPAGNGPVWSTGITSTGIDPGQGILSTTQPPAPGCTVSYSTGNAFTFTGTWAPDPPDGFSSSPIWQSGGNNYHYACIGASNFSTPTDNTFYASYKQWNDNRIDDGDYRYFSNLPWHGPLPSPGNSGVFRNGGSTGSGQAFFYTDTGIFVCTWQATPSGTFNHWNQNAAHPDTGTVYSQRCA